MALPAANAAAAAADAIDAEVQPAAAAARPARRDSRATCAGTDIHAAILVIKEEEPAAPAVVVEPPRPVPRGFNSSQLPELRVSREHAALRPEILEKVKMAVHSPARLRQTLTEIIQEKRITVYNLQALLLPNWGLQFAAAFQNEEEMWAYLNMENPRPGAIFGELGQVSVPNSDFRSARYAILIDGTAVIRLMTNTHATMGEDPNDLVMATNALLRLREVPWSLELAWAFPVQYQRRVDFLCCCCKQWGISSMMKRVILPFMGGMNEKEMCHCLGTYPKGTDVDYYSRTFGVWKPARVVAVSPLDDSVMVDIKQGAWLSLEDQVTMLRPRHEEEEEESSMS